MAINLIIGQIVWMVDSVGKKTFSTRKGIVKAVPTERNNYLTVEFPRKHIMPGLSETDEWSAYLRDRDILNNDIPWRDTKRGAIRYALDKKRATAERMKKSVENVEKHCSVLVQALVVLDNKEAKDAQP